MPDPLGLGLQKVGSCHMGAGNRTGSPARGLSALNCKSVSLAPSFQSVNVLETLLFREVVW